MSGSESPFASWDDAATTRLLRAPPPEAALRWAERAAGMTVERWAVLRGGTSSAMYVLDVAGEGPTLVLRCHVRPDLADEAPAAVVGEAAALRTVAATSVPAPQLVAHDPAGGDAGVPCVVMTWLPGRVGWDPGGLTGRLGEMAGVLPVLHAAATDDPALGRYASYRQDSDEPPAWATDRRTWARAVEVFHGPVLDPERCFIHRDLHPGNVLWQRWRVTGVVDWASACVGPPSIDVGHCRANLLGYAPQLVDRWTAAAERATGRAFHPWADIAALIGMLDGLRRNPPPPEARRAIERALDQAVTACT